VRQIFAGTGAFWFFDISAQHKHLRLHGSTESAVQRDTIRISAIREGRYRRALCYILKPRNGRTVSGLHRMHNKNG